MEKKSVRDSKTTAHTRESNERIGETKTHVHTLPLNEVPPPRPTGSNRQLGGLFEGLHGRTSAVGPPLELADAAVHLGDAVHPALVLVEERSDLELFDGLVQLCRIRGRFGIEFHSGSVVSSGRRWRNDRDADGKHNDWMRHEVRISLAAAGEDNNFGENHRS